MRDVKPYHQGTSELRIVTTRKLLKGMKQAVHSCFPTIAW